jgi:hypothetical protein
LAREVAALERTLGQDFSSCPRIMAYIFDADELPTIMQGDGGSGISAAPERDLFDAYFSKHFAEVEGCDPLDQATYVDIKTWMVDDIW